ncbi:MAG: aminotransferase class V-fold PLP-dependent enzyme [Eubacterium sp.]|nr:aminotransferase class V-fold PLP-dependent enzyme [Eubacterium sp.]
MSTMTRAQYQEINTLLQSFVADTLDFYGTMKAQPVAPGISEDTLAHLEKTAIPETGRPLAEVYLEMCQEVYANTVRQQHPRSFACIPSTMSPLSWMGEVMTAAFNPHASCQINAPAADLIEKKLIRWMCELAGYPEGSGGLFVSGGSIANLTALTAARDAKLKTEDLPKGVVYLSDQTHASVAKALHIIGLGLDQIRKLGTKADFTLNTSELEAAIEIDLAQGKIPVAVVASAGTTNTGSVDPLDEIADICRHYGLWMHVDGAFGASALLSEAQKSRLSGIEYADSLSWDAHKWMLQSYGCSVLLVRNQKHLVKSFAAHPEYLKDAEAAEGLPEFWDLGPELTRPARGLKLWFTLQTLGSQAFAGAIDHGCALAELAEKIVASRPGWEIVSPASLGILNFRCVGGGDLSAETQDSLNQEIARRVTESGFAQVFTTELRGRKVIRLCIINPETTEADLRQTLDLIFRAGEKAGFGEMQSA